MDVIALLLLQLLYDCCDVTTVMADTTTTTTTTYYSSASTSISGMKNEITISYRNRGSFNFIETTIENRFGSVYIYICVCV